MESPRSFSFDYRGAEAVAHSRMLTRSLYTQGSRTSATMLALAPAVALFGAALLGFRLGWWGDYGVTALVVAAGGGIVLSRLTTQLVNARAYRKISGVASNEGMDVTYAFGDEGYAIRTPHFDGLQRWTGVDRIVAGGGAVMFVVGAHAHTVPARCFATTTERDDFLRWVLEKLTPEARARSAEGLPPGWRGDANKPAAAP